jgi:hypothetical protein
MIPQWILDKVQTQNMQANKRVSTNPKAQYVSVTQIFSE